VRAAVALAGRAPSIRNSQPWLWTMREMTLRLSAARRRWLPATDPAGRDLLLSCGAALHHAQVAFAALGWSSHAHRAPNEQDPEHLASLDFSPAAPTEHELALCAAIETRRSDRRPYSGPAVAQDDLQRIMAAAQRPGVGVDRIDAGADRSALHDLVRRAMQDRTGDPAWRIERRLWAVHAAPPDVELGEIVLLSTENDQVASCLCAGEAASALMLEATVAGLSTCVVSLVTEVAATREQLRRQFLTGPLQPQLLVRIGRLPVGSDPLPATPRLRLDEIFDDTRRTIGLESGR
jgi:nitroreductase